MRPRHKSKFVGTEIVGTASSRFRLLRRFDLGRDGGHDGPRQFLLYREYVLQHPVVALSPDVVAGHCVDELGGHANPIRRLADASFQHVADAELAADLLDVGRLAFVRERRVARDHEERMKTRQLGDDIFCNTIGEILLLGSAAHILEWQHRDRRLIG
jgi:hypothetical protein